VYCHDDLLSALLIFTLVLILIWLSFSFAINQQIAIAQTQTAEPSFVPYSNPTFGIKIQYPANWGRLDLSFLQNDSADINFYPLDDPSGALSVRIQVNSLLRSKSMTFDEYSNMKIDSTEGQMLESNSTTLAGLPAHEIVISNSVLKTMQVWTLKDDRVFTITYQAEEEDFQNDLQVAQRMINSFGIINNY
jgi:eukaryotic-like serine/threonine-protein kinase